jgi:signal transduction histidine kinase
MIKAFSDQPRTWIVTEMMICLVILATVDYSTGYELRLLPFYCGPIFVVAWFCGNRIGIIFAIVSGVVSLTIDYLNRDPILMGRTQPFEIVRHLGLCLVVALAASALRAKRDMAAARIVLLEHSQRLEREIVNISETEQRRIGQDLHDGLCQSLAALSCAATSLRDDLRERRLTAEANTAADLADQLRETIVQTRDLAHGLAPAQVSQLGLALALEELARSVSRLQEVNCTFQSNDAGSTGDERVATHLYRIAQEAINNATRHGKARNIAISLESKNDSLRLLSVDDGIGFFEPVGHGMGLAVMRYRARLSGGELEIDHPKNGGVRISCTARLNEEEKSETHIT